MTENERNDAAEDVDDAGQDAGGTTGADAITPQAEVSGDDPAGFEVSGAGDKGGESESSAGGVGDWDPASAGGGGGELY